MYGSAVWVCTLVGTYSFVMTSSIGTRRSSDVNFLLRKVLDFSGYGSRGSRKYEGLFNPSALDHKLAHSLDEERARSPALSDEAAWPP